MGSTPTDHEKRIVFKNNQTHSKHCFPPCLVTSRILDDANPSVLSSRTKNHAQFFEFDLFFNSITFVFFVRYKMVEFFAQKLFRPENTLRKFNRFWC